MGRGEDKETGEGRIGNLRTTIVGMKEARFLLEESDRDPLSMLSQCEPGSIHHAVQHSLTPAIQQERHVYRLRWHSREQEISRVNQSLQRPAKSQGRHDIVRLKNSAQSR